MNKKLICIPFAHDEHMKSGVNISTGGKQRLFVYLKNACVALRSAKYYNPDCEVALATNLDKEDIPQEYVDVLLTGNVRIIRIPFDKFRFSDEYKWSLAFYKLCVLWHISQMQYDTVCYMDTDVFIQGSFDAIWAECKQNILLYDINHGLNTKDYVTLCEEVEAYEGKRKLVTHYGGEFFAASADNARLFCKACESVYFGMMERKFVTTKGDEFIVSLAADRLRERIKNAGAYIYRFWSGGGFRLVSTCYQYNRITVLHLPAEKERGMIAMYDHFVKKNLVPGDRTVWRMFRLKHLPLIDWGKGAVRRLISRA